MNLNDDQITAIKWAVSFALSNIEAIHADDETMTAEAKAKFEATLASVEELLAKTKEIEILL